MVVVIEEIFQNPAVTSYSTEPEIINGELFYTVGLQATSDEAEHSIGYNDPYEMAEDLGFPTEVNGVKCQYFFEGKVYANTRYRPVIGGISIASIGIGYGTAGGVVWDATDNTVSIL